VAFHGAEPNAEDGHPKPGSFAPSDETTAGAPTPEVEAGSVAGTGCAEAPAGAGATADEVLLIGAPLVCDGNGEGVGMGMVVEAVEDPVEIGPAGTDCTVPESPDMPNAQTVRPTTTTTTTTTAAPATQIVRAPGLRRRVR